MMGFLLLLVVGWLGAGAFAVWLAERYDPKTKIETTKELSDAVLTGFLGPVSLYFVLQEINIPLPWKRK